MLARLQQLTTVALLALSLSWAWLAWRAGHPAWAIGGALIVLLGYAIVLGLEFALLALAHGNDPAPRARPVQLLRAWWGEVCAAPLVFCWHQPFRSGRWPDLLPAQAQGRRGVLLIHGFVCNRGFWNPWLERLHGQGVPCVALSLEPVFGSIEEYARLIEQGVQRLERCTGQPPLVVAHSMGGLAFRRWYAEQSDAARVHHVITIGTPHRGTWLARFAITANGRQMRQRSSWLQDLAQREHPERAARFTCFYGHCDNIVFPPSTATLEGADNRHLCATAHVEMAGHAEPWRELQARLEHHPAP